LEAEVAAERNKRLEVEKEQEDLLVLLDELNSKRRNDKAKMKEKGIEVSEDEGDDGDGDDDDDDDEGDD
jgi:intracellular protein transport protein USO1